MGFGCASRLKFCGDGERDGDACEEEEEWEDEVEEVEALPGNVFELFEVWGGEYFVPVLEVAEGDEEADDERVEAYDPEHVEASEDVDG